MDTVEREVFYDFRKDPVEGEMVIKLKDLSKKYKFENIDNEHPNILNIFIDTVSRQRFHRRYKKVSKFLKKYHFSENKKLRVYEFFRLHSQRGFTAPNLMG